MNLWKRALSLGLGVLICISCIPIMATAEETGGGFDLGNATAVALAPEEDSFSAYKLSAPRSGEQAIPHYTGEGSLYSQLTSRQKSFYDSLAAMDFPHILGAAQVDGAHLLAVTNQEVYGLTLTGSFTSKSEFTPDSKSKVITDSIYTDLLAAITAYRYDCPQAFWAQSMVFGYRYQKVNETTAKIVRITFGFNLDVFDGEDLPTPAQMESAQEKAIQEIVSGINTETDTYTLVKAIHDALAARSEYGDPEGDIRGHMAYSALISGDGIEPVCDGYAKAFKIICDRLSVPCVLVSSKTHMWNNVYMDDGDWYNLDLTWDDQGEDVVYDYFLIGSQTIVRGVFFEKEPDHVANNPYEKGTSSNLVTYGDVAFSYPTKNKEAYAYIGADYPPLVFPDVRRSTWYYANVNTAYELGLFAGDNLGLFAPESNITRAQFCKVMASLMNADLSSYTTAGFIDVADGKWFTAPIAWAQDKGIMNGYGATFRPDNPITREEMCRVFYNAFSKTLTPSETESTPFPDDASIARWAREAVYFCARLGLVNGSTGGNFLPKASTRRCEAATVFVRCSQKINAA